MTKRRGKSQAKRKRQVFCRFDEFVILSAAKYPKLFIFVILSFRKKAKYPYKTHREWIKNRALKRNLCGYFANANMTIWIFRYAQNDKIYRSIETKIAKI